MDVPAKVELEGPEARRCRAAETRNRHPVLRCRALFGSSRDFADLHRMCSEPSPQVAGEYTRIADVYGFPAYENEEKSLFLWRTPKHGWWVVGDRVDDKVHPCAQAFWNV